MKEYQIIILGGGASGSMCALSCRQKSIAIIDNNNKIAKKLLATGNGRCNITNKNISSKFYNRDIDHYYFRFDNEKTLDFFEKIGLVCYCDEDGRFYPLSNTAKSVTSVIENGLRKKGVDLFLEEKVLSIEKEGNGYKITTDKDCYVCNKIVLAMGKIDNEIIKNLDLKSSPLMPSLVGLKGDVSRGLANIKVKNVLVRAYLNTGACKQDKGEVLFKENGLSGIVIFNVSTIFSRYKQFDGKLVINLLPDFGVKDLYKMLKERTKLDVPIPKFFDGLFASAIGYEILTRSKIDENKNSLDLTKEEILKLCDIIQNLDFKVKGCLDNAQVVSGGFDLNDFDENLQSKRNPNLYICGEICDVDGECGGYNLQWAWTSGFIVGQSL